MKKKKMLLIIFFLQFKEAESLVGLLIEKLVEEQTTSDMRMNEMEEKQTKFEERAMERRLEKERREAVPNADGVNDVSLSRLYQHQDLLIPLSHFLGKFFHLVEYETLNFQSHLITVLFWSGLVFAVLP